MDQPRSNMNDKDLLGLADVFSVPILTPTAFRDRLGNPSDEWCLSPLEKRGSACLLHDLFRLPDALACSCNTTAYSLL